MHGCQECPCSEYKLNNVCDVFSRGNKPFWIISSFGIQQMLELLLLMPFYTKTCRRAWYQRQCIRNSTHLLRYDFDGNLFVLFWIKFSDSATNCSCYEQNYRATYSLIYLIKIHSQIFDYVHKFSIRIAKLNHYKSLQTQTNKVLKFHISCAEKKDGIETAPARVSFHEKCAKNFISFVRVPA